LIHFVLSSAWICIQKTILKGHKPTAAQVINTKDLENILKSDMGYRELIKIRTSPNNLDPLQKNVFAIFWHLSPPTFFVTFTTGINNWPKLVQTLEELYAIHNQNNNKYKDVEKPKITDLVGMDPVLCARCYDKQMGWFRTLLKKCNSCLANYKTFFLLTKFQSGGYPHNHGLLWIDNALQYGIQSNEEIEIFIDKYLTTDRFVFEKNLCSVQIHQHKQACCIKGKAVCRFYFPKHIMKKTKILLSLEESIRRSHQKATIKIFE
jgi:hypothetical protein